MTPRDDDNPARVVDTDTAHHGAEHAARRTWHVPRHIGRLRTSTILLVVGFLATAVLRGYFISQEPATEGTPEAPAPTTTEYVPDTTYRPTVTATPTPTPSTTTTEGTGDTGTTVSPTTPPLIVLPPGIVPSGVELPPGVVVETTAPPTTSPPSGPATTTR